MLQLFESVSSYVANENFPLVVVLGPTASGKTSLSIELALHLKNAEIINADSRQLYKFLDIGTAKITSEEMKGVPHHLIDILEPNQEVAVGLFQSFAKENIADLHARGVIPIVVGGSMLYLSSIIDNLTMAPASTSTLRASLEEEYKKDNGLSLYKKLQQVDPEASERIHQNNMPRLVRAIEIYELTKQPKSKATPQHELRGADNRENDNLFIIGVHREREVLRERINKRTRHMFASGWIDEVKQLLKKGYKAEDPAFKSHGYRDIVRYIQELIPETQEELEELIAAKTRQYARRQLSWWRGDTRIHWINL